MPRARFNGGYYRKDNDRYYIHQTIAGLGELRLSTGFGKGQEDLAEREYRRFLEDPAAYVRWYQAGRPQNITGVRERGSPFDEQLCKRYIEERATERLSAGHLTQMGDGLDQWRTFLGERADLLQIDLKAGKDFCGWRGAQRWHGRQIGEATVNRDIQTMKTFLRWAREEAEIVPADFNPLAKLKKLTEVRGKRPHKHFPHEQLMRLINALDAGLGVKPLLPRLRDVRQPGLCVGCGAPVRASVQTCGDATCFRAWERLSDRDRRSKRAPDAAQAASKKWGKVALVLYGTAFRYGSCTRLDASREGWLRDPTPKDDESISVPVAPKVMAAARWLLANAPQLPLASQQFDRILTKTCRLLGIPRVTAHDLRKSAATRLHKAGVPTRVIQKLLGHSKLETTERYLGTDEEELQRLVVLSMD